MKTKKTDFVHLHVHTQYSLLDGMNRVKALMRKAQEFGLPSLAVTDHGVMFGAIDFYIHALEAGIKPIIGCEMYVARESMYDRSGGADKIHHLTLLAANDRGYRNLLRLVSAAHLDGFYYKPRVDRELLSANAEGLVAMSGCLKGEVPQALLQGRRKDARRTAETYRDIFGGRFYLEVMRNGLPEQDHVLAGLVALGKEAGLPLVATNDCHYLERADAPVHEMLLCIQTGKTMGSAERMKLVTDQFYFRSPEEMEELFAEIPEAIRNTAVIAESCNVDLEFGRHHLPHYHPPEGRTLAAYLRELAGEGLSRKLAGIPAERHGAYRARLDHELETIERMGFPGYFLIVWDFIKYARDRGIPVGPGRGSAAGSLVAWVLDITQLDPIVHGLIFERFLNPGRQSLPDIDVDFSEDRRGEVIEYVRQKYGEDRVAQIITFGTMKAKAAIKDVGRVMDIPYAEVDRIAKLVPEDPKMTLEKAVQMEPRLQELEANDLQVSQLIGSARAVEGLHRHASTHAAGVVISQAPLTDMVPLCRGTDGVVTTQYAMGDVERIGLLKFDFLGLRTLTLISQAVGLANRSRRLAGEPELDMDALPLDDPAVYQLLGGGDTGGIFQMESAGMTALTVKLKPTLFADLVALISLYRPGPMDMAHDFVRRKHGEVAITYRHPLLEPILKETYGIILYQEQVMRIASELGGFSLAEADNLRKAMGKKKPEEMAKLREKFIAGATERGLRKGMAGEIFEDMEKFAGYGFNKSHGAAYAVLAYQTAWLKTHFPVEFMAALLTSEADSTDKVAKYMGNCRAKGIRVAPPSVNLSEWNFTAADGVIRFGLAAVKNVGEAAIDTILAARQRRGEFSSLAQFCREVDTRKVNKRVVEALIKAGAFDFTGSPRAALLAGLDRALEVAQLHQRDRATGQVSIFDSLQAPVDEPLPEAEEMSEAKLLAAEKEILGFYISGHPLARHAEDLRFYCTTDVAGLDQYKSDAVVTVGGMVSGVSLKKTRKGETMAVAVLEDTTGSLELVIFKSVFEACREKLGGTEPLLVTGRLSQNERAASLRVTGIATLEDAGEAVIRNVHIRLEATGLGQEDVAALRSILARYRGESPVFVHLVVPYHSETTLALGKKAAVKVAPAFLREMAERFGESTVHLA
jgi:DNA polymerase-3 subunit alpha